MAQFGFGFERTGSLTHVFADLGFSSYPRWYGFFVFTKSTPGRRAEGGV
jgi:hypothetical protein